MEEITVVALKEIYAQMVLHMQVIIQDVHVHQTVLLEHVMEDLFTEETTVAVLKETYVQMELLMQAIILHVHAQIYAQETLVLME